MNKDTIQGKWHEIKGQVKTKWGKLTDDDITQINGKREELAGRLQKRYGYAKDKAEEEIKSFESSCSCSDTSEKDYAKSGKSNNNNLRHR